MGKYYSIPKPLFEYSDGPVQSLLTQPFQIRPLQGWQCPVCKAVWAPGIPNCTNCRPLKQGDKNAGL